MMMVEAIGNGIKIIWDSAPGCEACACWKDATSGSPQSGQVYWECEHRTHIFLCLSIWCTQIWSKKFSVETTKLSDEKNVDTCCQKRRHSTGTKQPAQRHHDAWGKNPCGKRSVVSKNGKIPQEEEAETLASISSNGRCPRHQQSRHSASSVPWVTPANG